MISTLALVTCLSALSRLTLSSHISPRRNCPDCLDLDGDGKCANDPNPDDRDCDDGDARIGSKYSIEWCIGSTAEDGVDNNCDDVTDGYPCCIADNDGDGVCDYVVTGPGDPVTDPTILNDYSDDPFLDCNPSDRDIHQGATELCDGKDNDCNGDTDENCCTISEIEEDNDDDGWTVCCGDCNDNYYDGEYFNPGLFDGCDGQDNDCDGVTDEDSVVGEVCGSDVGECEPGLTYCHTGFESIECDGEVGPTTEICDGLDNDCDGVVDNNPILGTCGEGPCTRNQQCIGGQIVCTPGDPGEETCNGLDDDCDGTVDNNLLPGEVGNQCGDTDEGECQFGTTVCQSGSIVCDGEVGPDTEICDGLDNDCDGSIDEDVSGLGSCSVGVGACVSSGDQICVGGVFVCVLSGIPTLEMCDGLDNDCDGVVDNNIILGTCGVGECTRSEECIGGEIVCAPGLPSIEICDGLDNNCDGVVDNVVGLGAHQVGSCTASDMCIDGQIQCVMTECPTECFASQEEESSSEELYSKMIPKNPPSNNLNSPSEEESSSYENAVMEKLQSDTYTQKMSFNKQTKNIEIVIAPSMLFTMALLIVCFIVYVTVVICGWKKRKNAINEMNSETTTVVVS